MSDTIDEKNEFVKWYRAQYEIAVHFNGDELCIPPRSGKSVPVIAHVAWAAWMKRADLTVARG